MFIYIAVRFTVLVVLIFNASCAFLPIIYVDVRVGVVTICHVSIGIKDSLGVLEHGAAGFIGVFGTHLDEGGLAQKLICLGCSHLHG